jgi:hypothetical protein
VVARWEQSELTRAEFCAKEKLKPHNLSWWRRQIKLRDTEEKKRGKAKKVDDKDVRESYWRRMMDRFEASGLDKYKFCEGEGIRPQAFSWWRGELERRDWKNGAGSRPVEQIIAPFVPLTVSEPTRTKQSSDRGPRPIAEIDILTGTVRIFDSADSHSIAVLLRALKELSGDWNGKHNEDISLHRRHGYAQEF